MEERSAALRKEVEDFMVDNRFGHLCRPLREMGVECVTDLAFVDEDMLGDLNLNRIQLRRLRMLCKELNPSSSAASNPPIAVRNTMNKLQDSSVVPIRTAPIVAAADLLGVASIELLSNNPASVMRFQQKSVSQGTIKSNHVLELENIPLGALDNSDSGLVGCTDDIIPTETFATPENSDSDEIEPVDAFREKIFRSSDMNEICADASCSELHTGQQTSQSTKRQSVDEEAESGENEDGGIVTTSKRRRIVTPRKNWVEERLKVKETGVARVVLSTGTEERPARAVEQENIMSRGQSRVRSSTLHGSSDSGGKEKGECNCAPVVRKILARLPEAMLTLREQKRRKCKYSYRRLSSIIISSAFDVFGNWMVHRKCLHNVLTVSMGWLSAKHAEAVERAGAPTKSMTKSDICQSSRKVINELIENIVLPPDCTVTARSYFTAQKMDFTFKVAKPASKHGLSGQVSNRSRTSDRELFRKFVISNRQPTGRTVTDTRRSHGPVYHLNAMYTSIRPRSDDVSDMATSFAATFNDSLRKNWITQDPEPGKNPKEFKEVSAATVETWLKEDFGARQLKKGVLVSSPEYSTLYPHKTDACATCEILNKDLRSLLQRYKTHQQQDDQGSLLRQQVLREVEEEIEEVKELLTEHRQEASVALGYHKACIENAAEKFKSDVGRYDELLHKLRRNDLTEQRRAEEISKFADVVSKGWFEICSDYQQNKSVPCWNASPQPGPTYYMSGLTHYVHILCMDSCGKPSGPSKFSRNIVYTRNEIVGGSKDADDTLSTLTDALLGYEKTICPQPSVFRSGYDHNGRIHYLDEAVREKIHSGATIVDLVSNKARVDESDRTGEVQL